MGKSTSARIPAALLLAASTVLAFQTVEKSNLPYKEIDNPDFIPAKEATFMSDRDRMIGVAAGRIAKAYPASILAQHGLVQDKLPDGPIAVTW